MDQLFVFMLWCFKTLLKKKRHTVLFLQLIPLQYPKLPVFKIYSISRFNQLKMSHYSQRYSNFNLTL